MIGVSAVAPGAEEGRLDELPRNAISVFRFGQEGSELRDERHGLGSMSFEGQAVSPLRNASRECHSGDSRCSSAFAMLTHRDPWKRVLWDLVKEVADCHVRSEWVRVAGGGLGWVGMGSLPGGRIGGLEGEGEGWRDGAPWFFLLGRLVDVRDAAVRGKVLEVGRRWWREGLGIVPVEWTLELWEGHRSRGGLRLAEGGVKPWEVHLGETVNIFGDPKVIMSKVRRSPFCGEMVNIFGDPRVTMSEIRRSPFCTLILPRRSGATSHFSVSRSSKAPYINLLAEVLRQCSYSRLELSGLP